MTSGIPNNAKLDGTKDCIESTDVVVKLSQRLSSIKEGSFSLLPFSAIPDVEDH